MGKDGNRGIIVEGPKYLFLILVSLFVFFPLYLMVNISLKNSSQIAKNPWLPAPAVETVKVEAVDDGVLTYEEAKLVLQGAGQRKEYVLAFDPVQVIKWERDAHLHLLQELKQDQLVAVVQLATDTWLQQGFDGILYTKAGQALVLPKGFTQTGTFKNTFVHLNAGTPVGVLRAPFTSTIERVSAAYTFINSSTGVAEELVTRYGQKQKDIPLNARLMVLSGATVPAGGVVYAYARRIVFKWENYIEAYKYVLPYVRNTIFIAVVVVVLSLLFSSLAAYAFARYDFFGKSVLFSMIILLMMIPSVLNLIPLFVIVKNFPLLGGNNFFGNGGHGMLNNYLVVILPAVATAQIMNIYILRNFFEGLSEGVFESGRIDGATDLQMYWHICLPLSRPIMGTLAIMTIVGQWNNYLWPLVTLKKESLFTITIGLAHLEGQFASDYGLQMAGFTLAAVPLIILFIFTMKFFIRGLSSGAIKF